MTIKQLYQDAMRHKEKLLAEIIEILVLKKKVLNWDDHRDEIYRYLKPQYNEYLVKYLDELRKNREGA